VESYFFCCHPSAPREDLRLGRLYTIGDTATLAFYLPFRSEAKESVGGSASAPSKQPSGGKISSDPLRKEAPLEHEAPGIPSLSVRRFFPSILQKTHS
jgi:hypothetical protein